MKQLKSVLGAFAVAATLLLPAQMALADNPFQTAQNLAGEVGNNAGITSQRTLPQIVGSIINIALGFLGIVFLVLLLYAGFMWMTAGGDEKKVDKARTMITQAIIGLVIIVAAFSISSFVLSSLINVSQQ